MVKKIIQVFILAACTLSFHKLIAQDTTTTKNSDPSYWQAGINYLSNSTYFGRQDSLRVPYLTPTIGYYNKSGLFITGSMSYLNSAGVSRIDLIELQAGYTLVIKKFDGEISATKDFYNSQSRNVKSETKGSLNADISYDFGFIKPTIQGGIVFNSRDDYTAGFGLEHSFFFDDDNFEVAPSLVLNASTQNYYNTYYTKRKYLKKKKNIAAPVTTISAYLPNAAEFKVMDYEVSLPMDYSTGKFIFNFTPTLAIPVNPNIVTTTITPPSGISTTKTKVEKLSNLFFWSVGITYSF
ncbi:MAG: hypothetical protein ABIY62_09525 [Ginsengibacter sp.]